MPWVQEGLEIRPTKNNGTSLKDHQRDFDIVLEMNVSSVAHTKGVWATEETFISNTVSTFIEQLFYYNLHSFA
jgi:hypothetical protein